jgi:hypothetical protein
MRTEVQLSPGGARGRVEDHAWLVHCSGVPQQLLCVRLHHRRTGARRTAKQLGGGGGHILFAVLPTQDAIAGRITSLHAMVRSVAELLWYPTPVPSTHVSTCCMIRL